MLEIKNLCANVDGKPILKGLTLTIERGQIHAIMGPNGTGKSTLLRKIETEEIFTSLYENHKTISLITNDTKKNIYRFFSLDEKLNELGIRQKNDNLSEDKIYKLVANSSGQRSFLELQKFFDKAPIEKTADTVLFFDEPERHISLRNRKKLIAMFTDFLEAHENTQIFAATHEPLFTQIAQSMIINFDTCPTTSIPSEKFDLNEYVNK